MKKINRMLQIFSLSVALAFIPFVHATETNDADKTINTAVKEKVAKNTTLSHYTIIVETKNGVVVLSGEVNSDKDAGLLVQETQSTSGVKEVDVSKLKIKNKDRKHALEDTVITAKVKGKFIEQELFGKKDVEAMSIHVSTKNGTVFLTGKAENQKQVTTAEEIAKSIKGVKEVKSTIKVEKEKAEKAS